MYHKVSPKYEWGLTTTTPAQFKAQMNELIRLGFAFSTLNDHQNVTEPIYVTFDDAYECVYEYALPVLSELGGTATVFPITGYIGRKNSWDYFGPKQQIMHMHWSHLKELVDMGWEIGSHSISHQNLLHLPPEERMAELVQSKRTLEDKLGVPVQSFCPPYNIWNDELLEQISEAGYTNIAVSLPLNPIPEWPGFILPRIGVYIHERLPLFRPKVCLNPLSPLTMLQQIFINLAGQASSIMKRLKPARI